jgi:hypothetical protein
MESKIKLLKVNTMEDGTERFQTQLEVGGDSVSFIRGTDGIMRFWGYGDRGPAFYEYKKPYEIVENKEEMRLQAL